MIHPCDGEVLVGRPGYQHDTVRSRQTGTLHVNLSPYSLRRLPPEWRDRIAHS